MQIIKYGAERCRFKKKLKDCMSANPSVGFYMNKLFIKNGKKCIIVALNIFL